MVDPDAARTASREWVEWFGAVLLLFLTLGGQAWRYLKESSKDDDPASHVVIERADLADMGPIREIAGNIREIIPVVAMSAEMLAILRRMDRDDAVRKEVEATLREERIMADRVESDREVRRRQGRD